jgi:hypothetical protein
MTEPSDEQIIADAMLLGLEFERALHGYRCRTPTGECTMTHKTQARAALWGLTYINWCYVDGKLTRRADAKKIFAQRS